MRGISLLMLPLLAELLYGTFITGDPRTTAAGAGAGVCRGAAPKRLTGCASYPCSGRCCRCARNRIAAPCWWSPSRIASQAIGGSARYGPPA